MNPTPPPNVIEAQTAITALLPHLPWPRLTEQIDRCGIPLPQIGGDQNLVILEYPGTLLGNIGPCVGRLMPQPWLPAFYHRQQRRRRNTLWLRLHAECSLAEQAFASGEDLQPDLDSSVDRVVAGVLLLSVRPLSGELRSKLIQPATSNTWGAFFAAHGMVLAQEQEPLLKCIALEPRLTAALWQTNPGLATPLVAVAMTKNDLWSATISLNQPLVASWLANLYRFAQHDPIAAATALILQPSALTETKAVWMALLKAAHPRLAYIAVRWARFTWAAADWEYLRDELRTRAVSDGGQTWFHWHRDCDPKRIEDAVHEPNADVLWQVELIAWAKNSGQDLKRRMVQKLRADPMNREARLTLRWLTRRGRYHD
jgi:hypothetical protein